MLYIENTYVFFDIENQNEVGITMQNYTGLIWLLIPFVFMIVVLLLFIRPRSDATAQKRAFYVVIFLGLLIVGSYFIIRTFIIPP